MAKSLATLMSPAQPVAGMAPDRDEAALSPSQCRYMQNVRATGGSLKVRKGSRKAIPPPVDGASWRGAEHGTFEGVPTTFVAFRIGSETQVYILNGTAWGAEVTTSGKRLAADGPVGMAITRDSDPANPGDILTIGNGTNDNLAYSTNPNQSYMGPGIGANRRLPDLKRCTATAGPPQWWTGANGAAGTTADVTSQDTGGVWQVRLKVGQDPAGDVVSCRFSSTSPDGAAALDASNGILLQWAQSWGDPADANASVDLFQYVSKLWLHGTKGGVTDWYPVPIPPVTITDKVAGPAAVESWRQMVLQTASLGITTPDGLQLTLRGGSVMAKDLYSSLLVGAAVGDIPGDTQYAVALAERGGRGESRPASCDSLAVPFVSVQMGPNRDARGDWPRERGLGSRFDIAFNAPANSIPFPFPSSGLYGVVYRSQSDSTGLAFGPFYRTKVAYQGGAAADAKELTLAGGTYILRDAGGSDLQSEYEAPDSLYLPSQPSGRLAGESSRLFGCAASLLWAGDADYPLRFRRLPRLEDGEVVGASALAVSFPGEEARDVRGMGAATGANGLSPLVLFTNKGAYRVAGRDAVSLAQPQRIAQRGILNPRCSCVEGGTVYWLDPQGRINATDGAGTADLSTGIVKEWTYDRLDGATAYAYVSPTEGTVAFRTAAGDQGGHIGFVPSVGGFHADAYPTNFVGAVAEEGRLIQFADDGWGWVTELADATGDGGEPIPVEVAFREMWDLRAFGTGRVTLQADSNPHPWTIEARDLIGDTHAPANQTRTLSGQGKGAGRWATTKPMEFKGPSLAVTLTGDSVPGVRIRGVGIETTGASDQPEPNNGETP